MWKKLHPKIATSEKHAKFGFSPFTLWTMMLPHTDTTGRYWANAAFIKGQCLPLFDHVRLEQVEEALVDLEKVGLIHLFDVGGKRYLVYHDSSEHNPTGGLKFQRSEWPAPPDGICGCLSRRDNAVVTTASPPLSLSSSLSSNPNPPSSSPEGLLVTLALNAKVIHASERQLRTHIAGWLADKGFQFCEGLLMNPAIKGKDVFWIHETYFKPTRNGKAAPGARRKVVKPDCDKCGGSGRRLNPITNMEMDCGCVREVAV